MSRDVLTFLEFLQGFRRGELLAEGDSMLEELMTAVRDTGEKGTLTLEFPFKVNKAGQVECDPVFKLKKPRRALGTGIYFVTDEGQLTRKDPKQDDLFDDLASRRERPVS